MEKLPSSEKKDKKLTNWQRVAIGSALTTASVFSGCQLGNDLGRMNNPETNDANIEDSKSQKEAVNKSKWMGAAAGAGVAAVIDAGLLAGGYKEKRRREKQNMAQGESVIG